MLTVALSTLGRNVLIFIGAFALLAIAVTLPVYLVQRKYRNFIYEHNLALKKLLEINNKYDFKVVFNFDMEHSYDNENFYGDISCEDYLIYELVYIQNKVKAAMKAASYNKNLFEIYMNEVTANCKFGEYDTTELLKNKKRLERFKEIVFAKSMLAPTMEFSIKIKLILRNINGAFKTCKTDEFFEEDINDLISQMSQKRGTFYLNDDIWKAICRVERGKVTNKTRFAIYQRDGHRCRKCGRKTDDLEIDHIVPIAKGGKSTMDNLQTLCRRCNREKGTNIEYY